MQNATLTDVKNRLSQYVRRVRAGERIRILVRGVPVADLVPLDEPAAGDDAALDARLEDLERRGILRRGSGRLDPRLLEPGPRCAGPPASAVLLEERRSGR